MSEDNPRLIDELIEIRCQYELVKYRTEYRIVEIKYLQQIKSDK